MIIYQKNRFFNALSFFLDISFFFFVQGKFDKQFAFKSIFNKIIFKSFY